MKLIKYLLIFAFLVQLVNGGMIPIYGARGWALGTQEIDGVEEVPVHVFFDDKCNFLLAIPSKHITHAIWVPEHEVM